MSARPWQSEAPLACLHSGQPPRAQVGQEAAEMFCACLERHVLPEAVAALCVEEQALAAIKERIANANHIEMEKLHQIQDRFRRITEIVQGAREALNPLCMPGVGTDGGEQSTAPSDHRPSDPPVPPVDEAHHSQDRNEPNTALDKDHN